MREFAAESFAYILRRLTVAQLPAALGHILSQYAGRHGAALDGGLVRGRVQIRPLVRSRDPEC